MHYVNVEFVKEVIICVLVVALSFTFVICLMTFANFLIVRYSVHRLDKYKHIAQLDFIYRYCKDTYSKKIADCILEDILKTQFKYTYVTYAENVLGIEQYIQVKKGE